MEFGFICDAFIKFLPIQYVFVWLVWRVDYHYNIRHQQVLPITLQESALTKTILVLFTLERVINTTQIVFMVYVSHMGQITLDYFLITRHKGIQNILKKGQTRTKKV